MTLISTLTGLTASLAAVAAGFLLGLPLLVLAILYPVAGVMGCIASQWALEQRERLAAAVPQLPYYSPQAYFG
ncbi:hypothetical protein [Leisingera sp. F5]|uniref:hypothetical protein n=1 Tax=Leisingera sp. F5 TaxID=1813816 RepID=UPI000A8C22B5|nr:hypothetical protein [Leisingera sp. F5]